jgi:hypothetical protein
MKKQLVQSVCLWVGLMLLWGCGADEGVSFPGGSAEDNEVSVIGSWLDEDVAYTTTRYIRPPGQVYGSGDGGSWENAHSGIPAQLARGTRYWLASGDYYIEDPVADDPVYEFDDEDTGAAFIGIIKATPAEHGDETGWVDALGEGPAILGPTAFVTGHYIVDGRTGRHDEPRGIQFVTRECLDGGRSPGRWTTIIYPWDTTATHVALRNVEISACGDYGDQSIRSEENVYNVAPISHIVYDNCYLHDAWRCHFLIQDAHDVVIENSWMARSGRQHESCTMSLRNTTNVIVRSNFITDSQNTFVSLQGTRNVFISSNVMTRSLEGWDNWAVIHVAGPAKNTIVAGNTVTGIHGLNGGFKQDAEVDSFVVRNNLFAHNLTNQIGMMGDFSHGAYFNNMRVIGMDSPVPSQLADDEPNAQSLTVDPFNDVASSDFSLAMATESGEVVPAPCNTDFNGNLRGQDGTWDRGAMEYIVP